MMAARQDWPGDGFDAFGRVVGNDPKRCEMFRDAMQGRLNRVGNQNAGPDAPAVVPDDLQSVVDVAGAFTPTDCTPLRMYDAAAKPVTISILGAGVGCSHGTASLWIKRMLEVGAVTVETCRVEPAGHHCKVVRQVAGKRDAVRDLANERRDCCSADNLRAGVVERLEKVGVQSGRELADHFGVTLRAMQHYIQQLKKAGSIQKIGCGNGSRYAATSNGKVKL